MDHVRCSACCEDVVARPPSRSFWGLIVSFWVFSLVFGIGAAISGWSAVLLVAWLLMACTVGVMAQRATSYTCPQCGSSLAPPADAGGTTTGIAHQHRVMTRA